jgi:adenylate cyclase
VRPLVTDTADVDLGSLYIRGVDPLAMGVEKLVLILFADIEGFTAFAENLLPYDVIYALNVYFHRVGEVIHSHGGHIDTYMGDGFMALFEAGDLTEGAVRAVRAGLELIRTVEELSPYLQELYGKRFSLRVGLHYGQVVAGKLGAPGNKKMTVIGDAVNLASRIEAANKQAGTRFLLSTEVSALVEGRVRLGRRAQVTLPGKSGEYTLWEVLGLGGEKN